MLGEIPTLIVAISEFLFFHIQFPFWVKFGMRNLNTLLLNICDFFVKIGTREVVTVKIMIFWKQ
jgi:hypothetical protein